MKVDVSVRDVENQDVKQITIEVEVSGQDLIMWDNPREVIMNDIYHELRRVLK